MVLLFLLTEIISYVIIMKKGDETMNDTINQIKKFLKEEENRIQSQNPLSLNEYEQAVNQGKEIIIDAVSTIITEFNDDIEK